MLGCLKPLRLLPEHSIVRQQSQKKTPILPFCYSYLCIYTLHLLDRSWLTNEHAPLLSPLGETIERISNEYLKARLCKPLTKHLYGKVNTLTEPAY
jgi:hypothetical protein